PKSSTAALQLGHARLLIELALYDANLQYRFPPAVLAAGALGVALLTVGPEELDDLNAGSMEGPALARSPEFLLIQAEHEALLDDLSSYCPSLVGREVALRDCERGIFQTWQDCCGNTTSRLTECYGVLAQRHSRRLMKQ
ncbi:unnamed protein product, partial [Polarella glacialis]